MIPAFDKHDSIRLGNPTGANDDGTARAAFTDIAGTATDPTAVVLTVRLPDATSLVYGWPSAGLNGTLTRESVGRFYFDLTLTQSGTHYWQLLGTGAVTTSEVGALFVRSSVFA